MSDKITQNRLKELLHYDPESGVFTWITTNQGAKAGDIAGTPHPEGYIRIKVNCRLYYAHRLAFLYMTGNFPKDQTDHINHIRDDNRWENLREANHTMNQRNRSMQSDNTSGHVGVVWHKVGRKWMARIYINGKAKYLGLFANIADAITARKVAEIKYGYHENHGQGT